MRCPNCQKTILDNVKRCPYCGHDTSKPAKPNVVDMFENTPVNPLGAMPSQAAGAVPPAEHHEAVHAEVKKRHWQRWAFYALIIVIVGSAIALMVKMNNDNTKLLLAVTQSQDELSKKTAELKTKDDLVAQSDAGLLEGVVGLQRIDCLLSCGRDFTPGDLELDFARHEHGGHDVARGIG